MEPAPDGTDTFVAVVRVLDAAGRPAQSYNLSVFAICAREWLEFAVDFGLESIPIYS